MAGGSSPSEMRAWTGKLESSWREESLKPRLALAALQGDQATFDALLGGARRGSRVPWPARASSRDRANEAVALFERLVEENPRSPSAQVNLFAARTRRPRRPRIGEGAAPRARDRAVGRGARRAATRVISSATELPAVYNMLLALDELQQPSMLDDLLRALSDPVRFSPNSSTRRRGAQAARRGRQGRDAAEGGRGVPRGGTLARVPEGRADVRFRASAAARGPGRRGGSVAVDARASGPRP